MTRRKSFTDGASKKVTNLQIILNDHGKSMNQFLYTNMLDKLNQIIIDCLSNENALMKSEIEFDYWKSKIESFLTSKSLQFSYAVPHLVKQMNLEKMKELAGKYNVLECKSESMFNPQRPQSGNTKNKLKGASLETFRFNNESENNDIRSKFQNKNLNQYLVTQNTLKM